MKIQTLISVMLAIVVGVAIFPAVIEGVDNYDILTANETFTAEEDDTAEEVLTLEYEPYDGEDSIQSVEVEGEEVDDTEYTFDGDELTLDDSTTDTDDEIIVAYEYETETDGAVSTLIDLLPILFVVIIVGGAVAYVRFR